MIQAGHNLTLRIEPNPVLKEILFIKSGAYTSGGIQMERKIHRMVRTLSWKILSCVGFLVLLASVSWAQTTTALITGTMTDASGAVLPHASVKIRNVDTGAVRELVTDENGRYTASQLPLGNYEVEASL